MVERARNDAIREGAKVRLTERCPWPERVGLTGTVVAPYEDGTYPQPAKWEVLLLIDNDPLNTVGHDPQWSCVMPTFACEVI